MGFFRNLFLEKGSPVPDPNAWMLTATKEELKEAYEIERQKWLKDGAHGERTPQMERLNEEINKRIEEELKNKPNRGKRPPREHGWNLYKDD